MKEEDVLDDIVPAASTSLPVAAKEAMSFFLDGAKSGYKAYVVHFQDGPESHEDVAGDLLEGKVDLILAYPPYNARKERSMDNSLHEIFTSEDISDFVDLGRQVLAGRPHGQVIWS